MMPAPQTDTRLQAVKKILSSFLFGFVRAKVVN
jgi:hypothetical protein